jgi:ribosomal-protein-alanine N-acetyltransferase
MIMENFSVEQISAGDINSLIQIANEGGLSPWSHQNFVDELSRDDAIMLLVRSASDDAAGFIIGRITLGNSDYLSFEAEIYNIGVDSRFRSLGIGKKLLAAFVERCKIAKASRIWLDVRSSNRNAISFYERNGFTPHSHRKDFYSHPSEDAIIMSLNILDTTSK